MTWRTCDDALRCAHLDDGGLIGLAGEAAAFHRPKRASNGLPNWVKGSCGRQADGTAGLPPAPEIPCVPALAARAQARLAVASRQQADPPWKEESVHASQGHRASCPTDGSEGHRLVHRDRRRRPFYLRSWRCRVGTDTPSRSRPHLSRSPRSEKERLRGHFIRRCRRCVRRPSPECRSGSCYFVRRSEQMRSDRA
jgi:hypothetical protein